MSAINSDNAKGWQKIADNVSRQRPSPGKYALVLKGKKLQNQKVVVVRHQIDQYENAFRYGNEASHHLREMMGRTGFVCLVRNEQGEEKWVKARYLMVLYPYKHWTEALADALCSHH